MVHILKQELITVQYREPSAVVYTSNCTYTVHSLCIIIMHKYIILCTCRYCVPVWIDSHMI